MSSTNGSGPGEPVRPVRRPTPTSTDPEVLAAQIEQTREDLAETLDAIADKVSPKRVVARTKEQVAGALASAKDAVLEQVGAARGRVEGAAAGLPGASGAHAAPAGTAALPPVTARQADGLDLSLGRPGGAPTAATGPTGPVIRPEYLAGGALGLAVLLLLRRRRARRRAVPTGPLAALTTAGADLRDDVRKAARRRRR